MMTFKNLEMFRSNALTIIAGTGAAFLFFGLANLYQGIGDKLTFLFVGVAGIGAGFGFFGWGLSLNKKYFGRISLPRDAVFSFQPVKNDSFAIVIDGLGSFGNRENQANVDVIARKTIKELVEGGATIRTARFYSRNGNENLLSDTQ